MLTDGLQLVEGSEATNLTTDSNSTFPETPSLGEIFYKTGANAGLYVYNGSAWQSTGGSVSFATITDLPSTLAGYGILDALDASLVNAANGVAGLNSSGKLYTSQLPALAITDTFPVATQAAMLALTAERGDLAIRSDLSKTFVLSTDSPTTLADWLEVKSPTGAVASVNGQTGAVEINPSLIGDAAVNKGSFTGSVSCNFTSEGSYFYGTVTGITTITIAGVPTDGKVYAVTVELTNANAFATTFANTTFVVAPVYHAGVNVVTLWTRNGTSFMATAA